MRTRKRNGGGEAAVNTFDLFGPHHFATVALLGWRPIKGTLDAG